MFDIRSVNNSQGICLNISFWKAMDELLRITKERCDIGAYLERKYPENLSRDAILRVLENGNTN